MQNPKERSQVSSSPRYIRLRELLTYVPMSASTVWRKVADESFPQPVRLSARITAWNMDDVYQWLREQAAQTSENFPMLKPTDAPRRVIRQTPSITKTGRLHD